MALIVRRGYFSMNSSCAFLFFSLSPFIQKGIASLATSLRKSFSISTAYLVPSPPPPPPPPKKKRKKKKKKKEKMKSKGKKIAKKDKDRL